MFLHQGESEEVQRKKSTRDCKSGTDAALQGNGGSSIAPVPPFVPPMQGKRAEIESTRARIKVPLSLWTQIFVLLILAAVAGQGAAALSPNTPSLRPEEYGDLLEVDESRQDRLHFRKVKVPFRYHSGFVSFRCWIGALASLLLVLMGEVPFSSTLSRVGLLVALSALTAQGVVVLMMMPRAIADHYECPYCGRDFALAKRHVRHMAPSRYTPLRLFSFTVASLAFVLTVRWQIYDASRPAFAVLITFAMLGVLVASEKNQRSW